MSARQKYEKTKLGRKKVKKKILARRF